MGGGAHAQWGRGTCTVGEGHMYSGGGAHSQWGEGHTYSGGGVQTDRQTDLQALFVDGLWLWRSRLRGRLLLGHRVVRGIPTVIVHLARRRRGRRVEEEGESGDEKRGRKGEEKGESGDEERGRKGGMKGRGRG